MSEHLQAVQYEQLSQLRWGEAIVEQAQMSERLQCAEWSEVENIAVVGNSSNGEMGEIRQQLPTFRTTASSACAVEEQIDEQHEWRVAGEEADRTRRPQREKSDVESADVREVEQRAGRGSREEPQTIPHTHILSIGKMKVESDSASEESKGCEGQGRQRVDGAVVEEQASAEAGWSESRACERMADVTAGGQKVARREEGEYVALQVRW